MFAPSNFLFQVVAAVALTLLVVRNLLGLVDCLCDGGFSKGAGGAGGAAGVPAGGAAGDVVFFRGCA